MGNLAWEMSVDTALEFYKRCIAQHTETEHEKIVILAQLAKEGKMTSITKTRKSKDDFIADKAKHFKILKIDKRRG